MRTILRLRATGKLTEQQLLTAAKYKRNPNRFELAPTLHRILRDIIVLDKPLEAMEEARGWPARSAKIVVSILLSALEETEGMFWSAPGSGGAEDRDELQDVLDYLTKGDDVELAAVQREMGLRPMEARVFCILLENEGACTSFERLIRRLGLDDLGDPRAVIGTHVHHLRGKIERFGYRIESVRGTGVALVHEALASARKVRDERWQKMHESGLSIREVARREGVQASTVLRRLRVLSAEAGE